MAFQTGKLRQAEEGPIHKPRGPQDQVLVVGDAELEQWFSTWVGDRKQVSGDPSKLVQRGAASAPPRTEVSPKEGAEVGPPHPVSQPPSCR